jgi:uncharacterized paraquat-inducible protein A
MKSPNCNKNLQLKMPPGLAKAPDFNCPYCNSTLAWRRNWGKGLLAATVCAVLFYLLGMLLAEKTFIIAFPVGGFILGLFLASRQLVKV